MPSTSEVIWNLILNIDRDIDAEEGDGEVLWKLVTTDVEWEAQRIKRQPYHDPVCVF